MEPKNPDAFAHTIADDEAFLAQTTEMPAASLDTLPTTTEEMQRYERRSLIGRGGMGEVHLCEDRWIGRDIAMKVILPDARTDAAIARFVREAKVQARLEHPSIVPVYDMGTNADGSVWFTMKRIHGRSLEDVIVGLSARNPETIAEFSRRKLLQAFVAVCYAVAFAHERGVLHRDLKPGNIMLGSFGEVSVLDWGIAKIAGVADEPAMTFNVEEVTSSERRTSQGSAIGTPGFMAPEQARGEQVGPVSDVYALGVILFELLALQSLHPATSASAAIMSTLRGVDARPSTRGADVPPELDALCLRATALEPKDRIRGARELAQAVERFLDGDRDLERRKELAQEHVLKARSAPASAALLELGRALALDPNNVEARDRMMQTLLTAPKEVPPEARAELDLERSRARRDAARAGSLRYLLWCAFTPLAVWMGVRNGFVTFLVLAFMFVSGVWARWMAHRTRPGPRSMLTLLVTSSLAIGLTSALFGPFLLVPTLAATNAMYFAMSVERSHRPLAIAASMAAIGIPFGLELVDLVPPAYTMGGVSSFLVNARASYFPAGMTTATLLITALATTVIPVLMVGRMRDALTKAEERLFLQAWQLRATLPTEARPDLVSPTAKHVRQD